MTLLFACPGNEKLAEQLATRLGCTLGKAEFHHFPDGETLVRLGTPVEDQNVILLCSLDQPDAKTATILFFADTAHELGAKSIGLVAPYLGYMRQDKRFHEGEAITSAIFARFLSQHYDWLVTVDPHLHRHKSMDEIYTIPTAVVHAADTIAVWITKNINRPVLIGPDEESEQWVAQVAEKAKAPYMVLRKIRHGDKDVEVSAPDVEKFRNHIPVLIDDIISTARTMAETITHLSRAGMQKPVCIGVHGVFAGDALDVLANAGAGRIVTCNTIQHSTNAIDIVDILSGTVRSFCDVI